MATKRNENRQKEHMTIWEYVEKYGTTQRFLADKIGISATTLNKIMTKKILPQFPTAWLIEKATDGLVTLYDWELDLAIDENGDVRKGQNK